MRRLLVCFLLMGCGANVVFGEGASASDGGGGSDGGAAPNGNSTSSTPQDGGGPQEIPADCEAICGHYEAFGCLQPNCLEACASAYFEPCLDELSQLNSCFAIDAGLTTSCGVPPQCIEAYAKYVDCAGKPSASQPFNCTPVVEGSIAGGACTSFTRCGDSASVFAQTCWGASGRGQVLCECSINGEVLGTCEDFAESCDVFGACCEFVLPWP